MLLLASMIAEKLSNVATLAKTGLCIIVLVASLVCGFEAVATEVNGTVYIRADGTVDPPTAPVRRDGSVYMLIGSISGDIVVEKDDIVINGTGYSIRGTKAKESKGISVVGRTNVTIGNLEITRFWYGIWLSNSSHSNIFENNITNNQRGIEVFSSVDNCIFRNDISNDLDGIELYAFSNNNIYQISATHILSIHKKPLGDEERQVAALDNILGTEVDRKGILGQLLNFGNVIANVGTTRFVFEGIFNPVAAQQDIVRAQEGLIQRRRRVEMGQRRDEMVDLIKVYSEGRPAEQQNAGPDGASDDAPA